MQEEWQTGRLTSLVQGEDSSSMQGALVDRIGNGGKMRVLIRIKEIIMLP